MSQPALVGAARRLRRGQGLLEHALLLVVAASAFGLAAVPPRVYLSLWSASMLLALLLAAGCARWARMLKAGLGSASIALDPSNRRVLVGAQRPASGWRFELSSPFPARGPLFWPGLAFLAWTTLQLTPFPPRWRPTSVSPLDTLRGIGFVASAWLLHCTAASVLDGRRASTRFVERLTLLGLLLSLVALAQWSLGATRIYWLFEPHGDSIFFGPFWNRNHFAGYMLLLAPLALGEFASRMERFRAALGERFDLREALSALGTPAGHALLHAALPPLAIIAAMVATSSRGALLAFGGGLVVAAAALRRRDAVLLPAIAFLTVILVWRGTGAIEERFSRLSLESQGRLRTWEASLGAAEKRWLTGTGLNTYAHAVTGWVMYPAAHNDYLQLLVETGLPGLAIGLWGAATTLLACRRSAWLLAAVSGLLLHLLVDFDLQIPAIGVLLVVIAALRGR